MKEDFVDPEMLLDVAIYDWPDDADYAWSDVQLEIEALERIGRYVTRHVETMRETVWRLEREREQLAQDLEGALDVIFYNADKLGEAATKTLKERYPSRWTGMQVMKKDKSVPMTEQDFDEILKERDEA